MARAFMGEMPIGESLDIAGHSLSSALRAPSRPGGEVVACSLPAAEQVSEVIVRTTVGSQANTIQAHRRKCESGSPLP